MPFKYTAHHCQRHGQTPHPSSICDPPCSSESATRPGPPLHLSISAAHSFHRRRLPRHVDLTYRFHLLSTGDCLLSIVRCLLQIYIRASSTLAPFDSRSVVHHAASAFRVRAMGRRELCGTENGSERMEENGESKITVDWRKTGRPALLLSNGSHYHALSQHSFTRL